jgi:hypothetical protein
MNEIEFFQKKSKEASLGGDSGWKEGEYTAIVTGMSYGVRMLGKKEAPTAVRGIWCDVIVDEARGADPSKEGYRGHILIQTEGQNAHISQKEYAYLCMALTGLPQAEAIDRVSPWCSDATQPARGLKLKFKTRGHENKKGKTRFYPGFYQQVAQTSDEVRANRAALDRLDAEAAKK